ncbi:PREDICTED: glutamate receptor ionotropic, kainate 5-like [Trachymyrmex cornetzi]|uniref:glutamate receptor ionotropic, kainate 5-like n=1 Tax=Trachymyrmex cornetzi TaxID=471704 RepID=UPI00084EE7F9|nr:PREDICTED: glutamate receptor ionotropic, kainate 5-like [Trachymyrmex cornetzi]
MNNIIFINYTFQEQYLVHFYDNNMKITGFCGEIWNLLSESLNFTLQLVKANSDDQGVPQKDTLSFKNGLLPIIFRNETIAIARLLSFSPELIATEFSIPFGTNRIQLYIHRETIYDNIWMVKIFSWKIWCVILSMCLLLSLCTFLTQSILIQNEDKRKNISLSEHVFYNFGNLCNQGYIPQYLDGKSRILEVSLGLFCSTIYMSFGAVLFIHLSKIVFVPPFDNFTTLVTNTKYNIIGLKDSTAEAIFKINEDPFLQAKQMKRLMLASTFEDMHKKACFSKNEKYVIFQTEAMYKAVGNIMCHLTNVGEPYAKVWMTSGIVKNFKYKRSIDLGILKLMEIGLLSVLKKRWLENGFKYYAEDETPKPIELHQVSSIIAVMCCGTIIALIIFIIETIIFSYKLKRL